MTSELWHVLGLWISVFRSNLHAIVFVYHCFTYLHEGTGGMFTASETLLLEVYCSALLINCVTLFCNVKALVSGIITTNSNTIS